MGNLFIRFLFGDLVMFGNKETKYEKLTKIVSKAIETDCLMDQRNSILFFSGSTGSRPSNLVEAIVRNNLRSYHHLNEEKLSLVYKAAKNGDIDISKIGELSDKYSALSSLKHMALGTKLSVDVKSLFDKRVKDYLDKGYLSEESISSARKVNSMYDLVFDKFGKINAFSFKLILNIFDNSVVVIDDNYDIYNSYIDSALTGDVIGEKGVKVLKSYLKSYLLLGSVYSLADINGIFAIFTPLLQAVQDQEISF